jgi:UDP-glucose 4-epimerase
MRAKDYVSFSVHRVHRAICKIRNLEDRRMAFMRIGNKLRVLLTGGSGFIGSHVADQFLAHGWEVVILGRTSEMRHSSTREVQLVQGMVGDRALLEQIFSMGINGVIHLACSTVPGTSNADKMFDVRTNLVESLELLECCVKYKISKLVLASSGGAIYGIPKQLPIPEESPTNPICSYGIVKLALEKYLELYHHLHGLNYVSLRISNPYGPRQDPNGVQGVISVFAAKMLQHKPLTVWGKGDTVRDFIHVRDIARLFYLAMLSTEQGVFNAGSGAGLSINDLIAMMSIELGVIPNIIRLDARKCDVPATVLSCRKAKQTFGWQPQISMEEGIREVGAWLSSGIIPPTQTQIIPQPAVIPAAVLAQMA